jgi:hypothetical protein
MEILLQDLSPGQEYFIQLRAKNQTKVSQWSRAYSFTTSSDITAPSPAIGLSWTVSTTSFVGEWTAPTTDSDGGPLKDFKDFKVTLTADATDVVFYVSEPRFDLSLSRNIAAWGSPEPSVAIKVEARDTVGNLSTPVTASATNPIPADVTGFDSTSALGGINLVWNHVADNDLKQYEIYVGGSSGFTPGPGNLKVVTTSNSVFYATDILTLQYFKIRAVDAFDQGSANYALESQVAYPLDGVPDSTAPSQPSAPTVSTATLVAQVSHAMTKQAGGNLESDVDYLEIHASNTSGFTPSSSTLRGTIDSAGPGIAVSAAFYFPTTDSMTNLYWKVIAVDRSKNKSSASNQTTGLPNLIENVNILNATITDAKVQNLSAAKLIAGTAIVNDLFIESNLTVSDAGTIESENFSTGVSGWQIAADGSVEFNDGLFRGDLDISAIYDSKQFSVEIGNMPSSFVWYSEDVLSGNEPTVLFKGWSFIEDGLGGFDPVRDVQTVMRLTPMGEFQIIFDPSHTSDVLSVDGNNQRDASGNFLARYYGWVDKRMGMGIYNDTSYESSVEGRNQFSNSYYTDETARANTPSSMGEYTETAIRIDGHGQADGSQGDFSPESWLSLTATGYNGVKARNLIPNGYSLFENAGGVSYYNTNTVRNRITINSIPSNLKLDYSAPVDSRKNTKTGLDCTLTSAGSGNHSIAFTPGSTTYNVSVTPGDRYYLAWYGYKPAAQSLTMRVFMKLNTGVTVYSTAWTFFSDSTNTNLVHNSNHTYELDDLLIVPSGATSAHFGIEFIGTVSSNQNLRISGVQLIKVFSETAGVRKLETLFDWHNYYPIGAGLNADADGTAKITLTTNPVPARISDINNPKLFRHSEIEFWARESDDTPSGLGSKQALVRINPLGMQVGQQGEYQTNHGEYRTMSGTSVPAFTSVKLLFSTNRVLNTVTGSTMSSYWNDMGIAMDNTPGYTTFVPQRAGLFLIHFSSSHSPSVGTTNIMYVDLCYDAGGAIIESGHFDNNSGRDSVTFVTALSAGEKVYIQVTHSDAATKTVSGAASFVQLL